MKQRLIVLSVCLLVVLTPLLGATAADSPRDFAPVQKGYVSTGERVLPYAPDRVFVQFTSASYKNSRLKINFVKGAELADGLTGLASVDALSRDVGVTKISRPYVEPRNRIQAIQLGMDRWFRVDLSPGADIEDVVARFKADPNVEFVKPDYRAFPAAVPSDPLYPDSWGHNNTVQLPDLDWGGTYDHTLPNKVGTYGFDANAQAGWDGSQGYGSSSVIIAILDSGVDAGHPDLNQVAGYDFGNNDSNPDDDSGQPGHGTCCAGVAAAKANNGLGACGAAPGCYIMPCKVANNAGSMYFSYIENAIIWAADNGADIISMSLGAAGISSDPATDAAISYAYNAGCVILAATGNENDNVISYPAINQYVIGVGAASPCGERKRSSSSSTECNPGVNTDPNGYTCDGERWWGSNYGVTTKDAAGAVDILGPTILPTTDIQGSGGYESGDYSPFFNGTSCATPYVAGVAGLIKSKNPTWTPAQVRDQLLNTAQDVTSVESGSGWDRYSGYGMVDAEAAVGGGGPVAPVAEFSGTPTSGTEPLTVSFTDQSSGSPTSWSWNFGDGGTSTAQNPNYTYNNDGTYTVTLTATNSAGSDGETKTNYITVNPCVVPTAAFTGTPTSGNVPLTVSFNNTSSGATSYSWNFGDGGTSTAVNPSHQYTAEGTYTVTLTATNACGNDVATRTNYITVDPCVTPVAAFAATPTSGDAPLSADFTDQSTGASSWAWTFGDGGTSTAQNPSHTYTAEGTYTVTLTATNSCGSDGETKTDYISVTSSGTGFCDDFADGSATDWTTVNGTWSVISGQLDGIRTDGYAYKLAPAGNVGAATITLDWTSLTGGSWTNGMVIFGWQDAQNYRVADFRDGANKWYIREFVGGTQSNKAVFAETINTNQQYDVVVDIAESGLVTITADGVEKVSYNFGNVIPGQVGVAVQNSHSQFDNFCVDSGVVLPDPPVAEFVGTPTSGVYPLDVQFTDQSTNGPTSWSWVFGDGGTSTAQNPSHTYTAAGTYTVTLTATNAGGADGETKTDYITVTEPPVGGWTTITYDDFEGGVGSYTDGGGDCVLYTAGTYSHQGSNSMQIRDNSGVASSFYHTGSYNVSGYTDLEVEFWFIAISMDNTAEDFWVQYYDGSTWHTVASYARTTDFDNGVYYNKVVTIPAGTYNYPTNAKLRFMCDASGNRDYVYIDEVEFRGYSPGGMIASESNDIMVGGSDTPDMFKLHQNYPNPFNPVTTIRFDLPQAGYTRLEVFNVAGQRVAKLVDRGMDAGMHEVPWNAAGHASGVYFYKLVCGDKVETRKMVLLR